MPVTQSVMRRRGRIPLTLSCTVLGRAGTNRVGPVEKCGKGLESALERKTAQRLIFGIAHIGLTVADRQVISRGLELAV